MERFSKFKTHLQRELERRCATNVQYSLRSFAKALDVHHGTLSSILSGKRPLTQKSIQKLGTNLGLSPIEISTLKSEENVETDVKKREINFELLEDDEFHLISDWYHDAILELTHVKDFIPNEAWVANRLGISVHIVKAAVERLIRLDLLTLNAVGSWFDNSEFNSNINPVITNPSKIKLQKQLLEKSIYSLENIERVKRDHSSVTMSINDRDLPKAKEMISKFRRELLGYLQRDDSGPNNVYQLQVSLFSLLNEERSDEIH